MLLGGETGIDHAPRLPEGLSRGKVEPLAMKDARPSRRRLDDVLVGGESLGREQRCLQPHAAGVSAMRGLGHAADVGAERPARLLYVQPEEHRAGGRGAERPYRPRRMKPGALDALGSEAAET